MAFDVAVHDADVVHVLEGDGRVARDFQPQLGRDLQLALLHVQQVEERALAHVLEHDVDVGDLGDHAHQDGDVRVPQDALHHDFVLDLLQQVVGQARVEDLLDGYGRAVQLALVDDGEAALTYLLGDLDVLNGDFPHAGHSGQPPVLHRHVLGLGVSLVVLLLDLLLQVVDLVHQPLLVPLLVLQLLLHLSHTLVLLAGRGRSLEADGGALGLVGLPEGAHPVALVIGDRRVALAEADAGLGLRADLELLVLCLELAYFAFHLHHLEVVRRNAAAAGHGELRSRLCHVLRAAASEGASRADLKSLSAAGVVAGGAALVRPSEHGLRGIVRVHVGGGGVGRGPQASELSGGDAHEARGGEPLGAAEAEVLLQRLLEGLLVALDLGELGKVVDDGVAVE
mmetsp:Transcript_4446/g.7579  ORF Transcript_4446/g.7579 Transcript_4446/m.7579 type:complete len:397 (+) Transcript_4446:454-1644(+)